MAIVALFLAAALVQNGAAKPTITATVQDVQAGADKKPAFLVEGSASYPDGVRLELNLYFEHAFGKHLAHAAAIMKDGKFSEPIQLPWPKNMAGSYLCRVELNPHLQGEPHTRIPKAQHDVPFLVGTAADAQNARQEWREKLHAVLKGEAAIVTEIDELFKANKKAPGSVDWKKAIEGWNKRLLETQHRAYNTVEYKLFADLNHISYDGLHLLGDFIPHMAHHASKGNETAVTLAKEKIGATIAGFEQTLTKKEYSVGDLQELAKEARKQLQAVAEAKGEDAGEVRGRFKLALLSLGGNATGPARETVMALLAEAAVWFKALDAGAPNVGKLRESLDGQLEELLDDLKLQK